MVSGWDKNPVLSNDYTARPIVLSELVRALAIPCRVLLSVIVYHFYG
ncbi:hypothetical protein DSM25559_4985 [Agrobacterium rosae]|uniref:Uncharacterized protein n=1 Tax=Agrobacterium rosae TaxID=1972867 RepID=A0A1R3U246_9HYPH|nr:hypothetical protein DSM25559_4985 [Agrobacterium rosae]